MTTASRPSSMRSQVAMGVLILAFLVAGFAYQSIKLNVLEERLDSLAAQAAVKPERATASRGSAVKGAAYVPAYSHVYSKGGLPHLLEVTLTVHNTDPEQPMSITRADYYDTKGKLLRRYVTSPEQLAPFETRTFVVEQSDYKGGSGSNFHVGWAAQSPVSPPVIEAVMVGVDPQYQVSFVRSGVPIHHSSD